MKLRTDAEAGRGRSILALKMLEQPTRMLGTCLMGTNLCAISIATLGTGLVLDLTTIPPSLAFLPGSVHPDDLRDGSQGGLSAPRGRARALRGLPSALPVGCPHSVLWFFERVASLAGGDEGGQRQVRRADIQLLLDASDDPNSFAQDKAMIRRVFASRRPWSRTPCPAHPHHRRLEAARARRPWSR